MGLLTIIIHTHARPERSCEAAKSKGTLSSLRPGRPVDFACPERNEVKPKGSGRTIVTVKAQEAQA